MNAQNNQNDNQSTAQNNQSGETAAEDPSERGLDDNVRYDARATGITMGPTGKDSDQVIIKMSINPGDGPWISMDKYNNISTDAGFEITMADVLKVGCQGFEFSEWVVDPKIIVTVILNSREYQGRWIQFIDKIWEKKPEYTAEVKAQKSKLYKEKFERAHQRNLEYQQNKALGQMAGSGNRGRSNELPKDSSDSSAAVDFGREAAGADGFATPSANGGRRARY